jgi:hypothetical protein
LKGVEWAPVTRLLENQGRRYKEGKVLGNPPSIPLFQKIDRLVEEFTNWIPTKTSGKKNHIINRNFIMTFQ